MNPLAWADEALFAAVAAAAGAAAAWRPRLPPWPRMLTADHTWSWTRPGAPTFVVRRRPPPDVVPLDLLTWLADPAVLAAACRHRERVEFQRTRHVAGERDPVRLIIDQRGRIAFDDGHHRLAAAVEEDLDGLPVVVSHVAHIPGWGRSNRELLHHLLAGGPPPHR